MEGRFVFKLPGICSFFNLLCPSSSFSILGFLENPYFSYEVHYFVFLLIVFSLLSFENKTFFPNNLFQWWLL
jgi:hypothetical protein